MIGYASFMKQFSTWDASFYIYMDCLFLVTQARSQGIGVQLMDAIEQAATEAGCTEIQWQTPNFNTRAIQFYKKSGFKILSTKSSIRSKFDYEMSIFESKILYIFFV